MPTLLPVSLPLLGVIRSPFRSLSTSAEAVGVAGGLQTNRKPRVIVLGAGWGGYTFLKKLNRRAYDVTCVSPRNHYLFTPLLPAASVGTVELPSITEPVRDLANTRYLQAECTDVDVARKQIKCRDVFNGADVVLPYDHLVISTGAKVHTFNVPGVEQHALLLKNTSDGKKLRDRLLDCFERAAAGMIEGMSATKLEALTRFVVVGAGPTSVEYVGELQDFIHQDAKRLYPNVKSEVVLVEVLPKILSMYKDKQIEATQKHLETRNCKILTKTCVKEVKANSILLKDGTELACGACVWSTGVTATPFITSLARKLGWVTDRGRLVVNSQLQVLSTSGSEAKSPVTVNLLKDKIDFTKMKPADGVYALGDCAVPTSAPTVVATAQVANQEAVFLAQLFNKNVKGSMSSQEFAYKDRGKATAIGGFRGIVDASWYQGNGSHLAWLLWRGVYLMQLPSWRTRYMVFNEWLKAYLGGRQTSR